MYYLRLELFLLNSKCDIEKLVSLCEEDVKKEIDVKSFLNYFDNMELYYIVNLLKKNKNLINNIVFNLDKYYFCSLHKIKTKDAQYLQNIINNLNSLLPENNNLMAVEYCFAVWLIISFNESEDLEIDTETDKIWVHKYELIQKKFKIFESFVKKIDFFLLKTFGFKNISEKIINTKELI